MLKHGKQYQISILSSWTHLLPEIQQSTNLYFFCLNLKNRMILYKNPKLQ